MPSFLEQYRITDFLDWHREKRLELNPNFQRGSVWTPAARSFLIDSVLRQLPIPKVYLRTRIDVQTKKSIREVVDGQQRLRAILDFAEDKFSLSRRAGEFEGLKYSTLSAEAQEKFLSYAIAVDQLVNASDDDVLEVFARLNSYSVALSAAEKRHAKYQGDFKWAVRLSSRQWSVLWDKYGILSVRDRVRMLDDSLTAEAFGILLEGVRDGGQTKIDSLYNRVDGKPLDLKEIVSKFDTVMGFFAENLGEYLIGSPALRAPHFLMLFSALAYVMVGIPNGDLKEMPAQPRDALRNLGVVRENLLTLGAIIDNDDVPNAYEDFWQASKSSTQRIASRRVRFPMFVAALGADLI